MAATATATVYYAGWNGVGRTAPALSTTEMPVMAAANPIVVTDASTQEFRRHFREGAPDACWDWTGRTLKGGYGYFRIERRNVRASRYAFALHFWEPPTDMEVCHTCDRPCCTNPAHLFLGTHKENHEDSGRKGRKDHLRVLRGSHIPMEQEIAILDRMRAGETDKAIADDTGFRETRVHALRRRNYHILGVKVAFTKSRMAAECARARG